MEFSHYVINAISSIVHLNEHHHWEVVSSLKSASSMTDNAYDSHALAIISGALSMSYSMETNQFTPMIQLSDGQRSFAPEDLADSDIEILKNAAVIIETPWMQARLFHIIWLFTNDYQYGQSAVNGYLRLFEETFDPDQWVDCWDAIERAYHISIKLGKKSTQYKQTRTAINQKLAVMNGTDPLFLSLQLLQLMIKDATQAELEAYIPVVNNLASKNICDSNANTHLAEETFAVQVLLLRKLKKSEEVTAATLIYAEYYESIADSLAEHKDYHRAVMMLKQACVQYHNSNSAKLLPTRHKLESLQEKALQSMQSIPFEFDATRIHEHIDKLFTGLSLREAIVQLGRLATTYKKDDVKERVLEKNRTYVFSSFFGKSLLDEKGHVVHELPPLNTSKPNPDVLLKHMFHYVTEQRSLIDSIVLRHAFGFVQTLGVISEDDLEFLVRDNAIIPDGRSEIIKEGLYLGLTGKLYTAMHILLPQTENIFRYLVKMCGDTVTFLDKEYGTEQYKPLSALFNSEKLKECYDENLLFTFQSILNEEIGENLRNLNAHGILEPQKGNGSPALCFLCLLIKLLSIYGKHTIPVMNALSQRNP